MATSSNRPSTLRSIIITIIVIIVLVITLMVTIPFINNQISALPGSSTLVFYEVEGSADKAVITYTRPDGRVSEPRDVDLPWRSPAYSVPSGTMVILTAAAIESGTVKCTIKSGAKVVDTNTNNPFIDKAMCGGYVK